MAEMKPKPTESIDRVLRIYENEFHAFFNLYGAPFPGILAIQKHNSSTRLLWTLKRRKVLNNVHTGCEL